MSHLRSALHAGAYAVVLLATLVTVNESSDAQASIDAAAPTSGAVTAATRLPDPAIERALLQREKRVSRSAARREARPARVAPRVVISKITWTTPVESYRLTGRFGDTSSMWSSGVHTGLDFAAPSGTPIRSVAAGVVKQASYDGAYGYKTVVTLPDGGEVWYCHQERLGVRKGQRVAAGQVIGYVGATGNVTGSHVHLEVRYGDRPVDPALVLARNGVSV